MAAKQKFYVVWVGRRPGVYSSWQQTQAQINGYKSAKYRSFKTRSEAETAFREGWQAYYEVGGKKKGRPEGMIPEALIGEIEPASICVDAACSGNPGVMEYRGVYTFAPEIELFHSPKWPAGTNNIGEFLAIVHALAMFHEKEPGLTIYSDSKIAMGWVDRGECRTKLPEDPRTAGLWEVIRRGEKWLSTHDYDNPILKWETKKWGEIPADFGRK